MKWLQLQKKNLITSWCRFIYFIFSAVLATFKPTSPMVIYFYLLITNSRMELSQYHFSREQKPCSVSVLIGSRCICIQKLINLELKQILFQSFFERFLFYKMIGDKTPSTNRKLTVVHKMDTLYRVLYIIWVWILYSSDIVLLMEQVLLLR